MKTRRIVALLISCLCLAGLAAFLLLRRPSPESVAQDTIRALERGDTDTLIGLALPAECRQLNLTHSVVDSYLHATLWSHGMPDDLTLERMTGPSRGMAGFMDRMRSLFMQYRTGRHRLGHPTGRPTDAAFWIKSDTKTSLHHSIQVLVFREPDGSWRLGLSWLLFQTAHGCMTPPDSSGDNAWVKDLHERYGIKGVRDGPNKVTLWATWHKPRVHRPGTP